MNDVFLLKQLIIDVKQWIYLGQFVKCADFLIAYTIDAINNISREHYHHKKSARKVNTIKHFLKFMSHHKITATNKWDYAFHNRRSKITSR